MRSPAGCSVSTQSRRPDLTVLICTHNRADLLLKTLQSLNRAEKPVGWLVDMLVVLNACHDETESRLEGYARQSGIPFRQVKESIPGKSRALNRGLTQTRSNIIAFVDDDHQVDGDYLVSISRAAEIYPEVGLFCGRIYPDWDGSEPSWVHDDGPYAIRPRPVPYSDLGPRTIELNLRKHNTPGGGNLIARRRVFDLVGVFSVELGPQKHNLGGGEDADFVLRAMAKGEKLRYVPDIVQYHYVDPRCYSLTHLLRKSFQRSRTSARVQAGQGTSLPFFSIRKALSYGIRAATSIAPSVRRYYLVRIAAALGEGKGIMESRRPKIAG